MKEKKKISLSGSIWLYAIIMTIVFVIVNVAKLALLFVIQNEDILISIESITNSIPYDIISTIIAVFIYTSVYIFFLRKKYIVDASTEKFIHSVYIFIIVSCSLAIITNLIINKDKLNSRIHTIGILNVSFETQIENDKENFKKLSKDTPWKNCNSTEDIREVTYKASSNAIYQELVKYIVIITTELLSSVVIMEFLIKKESDVFLE